MERYVPYALLAFVFVVATVGLVVSMQESPTAAAAKPAQCSETDYGKNPQVLGRTTGFDSHAKTVVTRQDYCLSVKRGQPQKLVEYFCTQQGMQQATIVCKCLNGKCI